MSHLLSQIERIPVEFKEIYRFIRRMTTDFEQNLNMALSIHLI